MEPETRAYLDGPWTASAHSDSSRSVTIYGVDGKPIVFLEYFYIVHPSIPGAGALTDYLMEIHEEHRKRITTEGR